MKVVRLSALRTGRFYPKKIAIIIIIIIIITIKIIIIIIIIIDCN